MEVILEFFKALWTSEIAKITAFALFYMGCFIYIPLKLCSVLGSVCSTYNRIIDDAAGIRRHMPQKRPMSDNNTSPIPEDPRYR